MVEYEEWTHDSCLIALVQALVSGRLADPAFYCFRGRYTSSHSILSISCPRGFEMAR